MFSLTKEDIKRIEDKWNKKFEEDPIFMETANKRNRAHIEGVQKFANRLNLLTGEGPEIYPNHDDDKFEELKVGYILITLGYNPDFKDKLDIDEETDEYMRLCTFKHVTQNPHHPEYWDIEAAKISANVPYNQRDKAKPKNIDATKMTNEYLREMVCDWSSVGAEKGNSPQSWFERGIKDKWVFNEEQIKYIKEIMDIIWPGGEDETSKIEHKERMFNDKVFEILNKEWVNYSDNKVLMESMLNENYEIDEFLSSLTSLLDQKDEMKNVVDNFNKKDRNANVNINGVGSLQAVNFLFSNDVTNYIMSLMDSLIHKSYSKENFSNQFRQIGLDAVEFGKDYNTKAKITNHFANGLSKSLDKVNISKLKSKILLVSKLYSNMKRHAKTISNKLERKEYLEDIKAFFKVAEIIKNIVKNRGSFINILNKTLLINEDTEVVSGDGFVNIYRGE